MFYNNTNNHIIINSSYNNLELDQLDLDVYNIMGKLIYNNTILKLQLGTNEYEIPDIPPCVYYVLLKNKQSVIISKTMFLRD